jgi:hypothetical protein
VITGQAARGHRHGHPKLRPLPRDGPSGRSATGSGQTAAFTRTSPAVPRRPRRGHPGGPAASTRALGPVTPTDEPSEDPAGPPQLDAPAILEALERHFVDYIMVGGYAAELHGSTRRTADIDVVPDTGQENLTPPRGRAHRPRCPRSHRHPPARPGARGARPTEGAQCCRPSGRARPARRGVRGRLGGGVVGYLVFVEFTSGALQGYYIPLLTDIARHLGINDADVWLEAGQLLLAAVAIPIVAKLGDLHAHRRMLLVTAGGVGVATLGVALAQTFAVFLLFVQNLYATWLPLQVALVHDRSTRLPDREATTRRATRVVVAALQAGAIVGALSEGFLVTPWRAGSGSCCSCPPDSSGVVVIVGTRMPESSGRVAGRVDAGGAGHLAVLLVVVTAGLTAARLAGTASVPPRGGIPAAPGRLPGVRGRRGGRRIPQCRGGACR